MNKTFNLNLDILELLDIKFDQTLTGGQDDDLLEGGAQKDLIQGFDGNDTLEGGAGTDSLEGGEDDDILDGGSGNDTLIGDSGSLGGFPLGDLGLVALTPGVGQGNDFLNGGDGDDVLDGVGGNDTLIGGEGDDTLFSGTTFSIDCSSYSCEIGTVSGSDTLIGGGGEDHLLGSDGSDRLVGDDGNDTLEGGANSDTLIGGSGADRFRFSFTYTYWYDGFPGGSLTPVPGIDTVEDYNAAEGDQLIISAPDSIGIDQFQYNSETGSLSYNEQQFAQLPTGLEFVPEQDLVLDLYPTPGAVQIVTALDFPDGTLLQAEIG